ncbi:MAG: MerR family DNA-binding transcriptional regulator [Bryobacteraceae bacterium]
MQTGENYYLLSHEVAELLGVSTQTLYNWIRKGRIPDPPRHPLTSYRLWTVRDVEVIRQTIRERKAS